MVRACAPHRQRDFSAFATPSARLPLRDLMEASVHRDGNLIVLAFRANAFLHHMVRNIVGSLVYVGAGKHPSAWIAELIESRDRRRAAPTFAPDGLYLSGVEYDPAFGLPRPRALPLPLRSP